MQAAGKKKCAAIVLAAGRGSRMGTKIQKQYLEIEGKPVLYYALEVFEKSEIIDDVVLVVGREDIDFCRREIVERYQFQKVSQIVAGGKERYESVYHGLEALEETCPDYVFIHDGARPFVDELMLKRVYEAVERYRACVVGMPSKDTIKIVDDEGMVIETPNRKTLWQVQTPQVFEYELIKDAYTNFMQREDVQATDDAMVLEMMAGKSVRLVEGSYENIKITTPEDLGIAELFLKKRKKCIDNVL